MQPYHTGIMELNPFIADMDFQQAQAVQGIAADPAHIEVCFPTVHDPSLAPEGKHIMTIDVNSQPYTLRDDEWDDIKEDRADRAIAQMAEYFPDLPDLIEHRQVVTPLDMERLMGLTGGHALHGDMAPDQLLFLRPVRGWADYRTPIRGLYLCGAGTHPGGGVTGANGRNAAREVLRDAKRLAPRERGEPSVQGRDQPGLRGTKVSAASLLLGHQLVREDPLAHRSSAERPDAEERLRSDEASSSSSSSSAPRHRRVVRRVGVLGGGRPNPVLLEPGRRADRPATVRSACAGTRPSNDSPSTSPPARLGSPASVAMTSTGDAERGSSRSPGPPAGSVTTPPVSVADARAASRWRSGIATSSARSSRPSRALAVRLPLDPAPAHRIRA